MSILTAPALVERKLLFQIKAIYSVRSWPAAFRWLALLLLFIAVPSLVFIKELDFLLISRE